MQGRRLILATLLATSVAGISRAQIGDPVPGNVPIGSIAANVEVVAQLPDTGPAGNPRARPMTLVGDGSGRRFVADQNGHVWQIHADGSVSEFLDIEAATDLEADQGQMGLSSIAFHPDYHVSGTPGFGMFFTASSQTKTSGLPDYPVPSGAPEFLHSVIHEWLVSGDPNAIDPTSGREVLRVAEIYRDHNLAQIAFDDRAEPGDSDYGLLFISLGDGGNVGNPTTLDPFFSGQSLATPLGKILRIDPLESGGGDPYSIPANNPFASDGDPSTLAEIWAYGLRNPHRFSWDRGSTGRMLISDIGQANIEEINLGAMGANYGWSEREGTFQVVHDNVRDVFPLPGNDASFGFTYPVIQYDHDEGDRAVSGGYVFRSSQSSPLEGQYLFGDLRSGRVFYAPVALLNGNGQVGFEALRLVDATDDQEKSLLEMIGGGTPAPRADLRFGMDDAGRIYLVTKRDGLVRELVPIPVPNPPQIALELSSLITVFSARALRRRSADPRIRRGSCS